MNKDWFLVRTTVFAGFLLATGCSLINAPSEVKPGDAIGGAGGGSSSSSVSNSSSASSSSSSTGFGGSGGNMMMCEPGSQSSCYDGDPAKVGIGTCQMGTATCAGDGNGYGPCEGQVVPAAMDDCTTPLFDENCDGVENDNCPGERLAIVAAVPAGYANDVLSNLMLTMKFVAIDLYDASILTPTLAELQAHQSVLVFSDKVFFDPVTLGNVLADYYDAGGRVVLADYSNVDAGARVQGRFGDPAMGYLTTDPSGKLSTPSDDALGNVLEPQSRLMRNVSVFTATASIKSNGTVINGGIVVAQWLSGLPLITRSVVKGRNRVDVNFYPPQVQMGVVRWNGDGAAILSNAVLF